jgi:hypothetical protein
MEGRGRFLTNTVNEFANIYLLASPNTEYIPVYYRQHKNSKQLVSWTLSIVYISIKLQRFGSWIFFRLQVKKGRTKTLTDGPPG